MGRADGAAVWGAGLSAVKWGAAQQVAKVPAGRQERACAPRTCSMLLLLHNAPTPTPPLTVSRVSTWLGSTFPAEATSLGRLSLPS